MKDINLVNVQNKIHEQLRESGWADKLKMFILSDEFYNILEKLANESRAGNKFTPTIKNLFKAFIECPYHQLKVVFVGQDPYPKEGVADGIAFSCSNTEHPSQVQPSLRQIYKALDTEGVEHFHTYNLKDWANQGMLMLNSALTTQIGTPGAHKDIWKPFVTYLFDVLNSENAGIVYVFMGNAAQAWMSYVSEDRNHLLKCTHPASAVYNKEGIWDSNGVFNEVTKLIKDKYNTQIKW
jgi:uracil-DNA glycosylase